MQLIIQSSFRIHQNIYDYGNLGEEIEEEKGIGNPKNMQLSFTTKTLWQSNGTVYAETSGR